MKDTERKRNGDDDQVCVVGGWKTMRGWKSRVSRVSPFDLAPQCRPAAGLCPFVIPCMEYATYACGYIASDTGMQHAPFRITRLWMGKESRGRENRQSCRNI